MNRRRLKLWSEWALTIAGVATVVVHSLKHGRDSEAAKDGVLLLDRIEVHSSSVTTTDPRLVEEASGLLQDLMGSPLLSLSIPEVERRVLSHPWIRAATVTRELPGALNVTIEPRKATAIVPGDKSLRVLGDQGEWIAAEGKLPNVPVLTEVPKGAMKARFSEFLAAWNATRGSQQGGSTLEQVSVQGSAIRLSVEYRDRLFIVHADLTQSIAWIGELDRALDVLVERGIAVRHVSVLDDKKFVVKTS